jgi:hypothetical protein
VRVESTKTPNFAEFWKHLLLSLAAMAV